MRSDIAPACGCATCYDANWNELKAASPTLTLVQMMAEMPAIQVTCPECGNKRCPKASHHVYACTHSNEPGQRGSFYT